MFFQKSLMRELYRNVLPGWKKYFDELSDDYWDLMKNSIPKFYLTEDLFKPFQYTPYEDLKVIVFGKKYGTLQGIPKPDFAMKYESEFKSEYILELKEFTKKDVKTIDFERVSKQGVLFVNLEISPYTGQTNPWETFLKGILTPIIRRGWVIILTCYTTPYYQQFVKHLIDDQPYIIHLKVKFNKTDSDYSSDYIKQSGIFFRINSYLTQWCLDPIDW
jgi:uracil DNA glycosylase